MVNVDVAVAAQVAYCMQRQAAPALHESDPVVPCCLSMLLIGLQASQHSKPWPWLCLVLVLLMNLELWGTGLVFYKSRPQVP